MRPNRLVRHRGRIFETISYPFPVGEMSRIKVRDPGDPTTLTERSVNELTEINGSCAICHTAFETMVLGEYRACHLECPGCGRSYQPARDSGGNFLGRFVTLFDLALKFTEK